MGRDNKRNRQLNGSPYEKTEQSVLNDSKKSLLSSKIAKSDKRRKKTHNSRPRGLIVVGLLILVFLILLLALIYKMPDSPKQVDNEDIMVEKVDMTTIMSFSSNEAKRYYPFSDQLVYLSQDKIEIKNYTGEIIYDEFLEFERPVAVYNDDYFLAGDRNSNKVLILNHQTKHFSLQLDGVFAGGYFAGQDYLAVIEENFEQPGFVHIVDLAKGEKILTIQFVESGYPLAVAFSNNLDYFDVLLVNTKGAALQPVIKRYNLAGTQIAQTMLNGYPFLYAKIFHDKADNIILASTSNILVVGMDEKEALLEYNSGKVYELISSTGISAFVSNRVEGDMFVLDWDSANLAFVENKVDLLHQIDQYCYHKNFIAISNNNHVQVYDQNSSKLILDQIIDSNIVRLSIRDGSLILITEQGLKTLNFSR